MAFEQMGTSLIDPLSQMGNGVLAVLPGLIGGLVVLIVGWIVAAVVARLVHRGLDAAKLEKYLVEKTGLKRLTGAFDLTGFLSLIIKWFIFVPFMASAADLMQLGAVSDFLRTLATWIPNAIGAIIVAFFGIVAAEYVAGKIESTKMKGAPFVAGLAHWIVVVLVALIVLDQIGLRVGIIKDSFTIILAGVMLAFAIAVGMGFGFALKDDAKSIMKNWKR